MQALFGNWVRDERTKHGMTRLELADAVGVSETWIARIEQNKKGPSPKLRGKIQRYFDDQNRARRSSDTIEANVGDIIQVQGVRFRIKSLTLAMGHPPKVELVSLLEEVEVDYATLYEQGKFWRIDTPYNHMAGGELEYSAKDVISWLFNERDEGRIPPDWMGVTIWGPDGKTHKDLAVQRFIDFEGRV